MRLQIHTLGTRGDVQPYVALAIELQRRGHEVQLVAPERFEHLAAEHEVPYSALPGAYLRLLDTDEGKAAMSGGKGFSGGFKLLKHMKPLMEEVFAAECIAAKEFRPDLLIYHPKALAAPHIAEAMGMPLVLASPLPGFTATRAFASPIVPFESMGPFNRLSHRLMAGSGEALFRREIRRWRNAFLGLSEKPKPSPPVATLYGYSRHLLPVPNDWGPDVLVSGFWFLDHPDWELPDDLRAFLDTGDPPVYAGFGSVPGIDAQHMADLIADALEALGLRGVMATGAGGQDPPRVPDHLHLIRSAPHDRLLPHMRSALIHGGAGTTGAALRAGLPAILCPFFGDQPFWARRVHRLGVGPAPLDRSKLSVDVLKSALASAESMRDRAAELGTRIRAENGVGLAADRIERVGASSRNQRPAL